MRLWANGHITLPEDLLPKLEEVARVADDLAKEAVEKLLKERSMVDLNSREEFSVSLLPELHE